MNRICDMIEGIIALLIACIMTPAGWIGLIIIGMILYLLEL